MITSFSALSTELSYSNFCNPLKPFIELNKAEITWSPIPREVENNHQPFGIEFGGTTIPVFDLTYFSQLESMWENSVLFEADDKSTMYSITIDNLELQALNQLGNSALDPDLSSYLKPEQTQEFRNFYKSTLFDVLRRGYEITPSVLNCHKIVDKQSFQEIVNLKWLENMQTLLIKVASLKRNSDYVFDINGKDYGVLGKKSFEIILRADQHIVNVNAFFVDSKTTREHFFSFITAIKQNKFNLVHWTYFGVTNPKLNTK